MGTGVVSAVVSCFMLALPGLDSTLESEAEFRQRTSLLTALLETEGRATRDTELLFLCCRIDPHPQTGSVVSSDFLISFLQRRFCVQV